MPRILELFRQRNGYQIGWIPHFTSVLNWSLRLGLGLLKQVQPITQPWLCIIDHSIDIDTKKALVVLRVKLATLAEKGSAIQRQDCECIGLKIAEKVTGETLLLELTAIFTQVGQPSAILKDSDATLNKGVRLWSATQIVVVPTIDDIGHSMANELKAQF